MSIGRCDLEGLPWLAMTYVGGPKGMATVGVGCDMQRARYCARFSPTSERPSPFSDLRVSFSPCRMMMMCALSCMAVESGPSEAAGASRWAEASERTRQGAPVVHLITPSTRPATARSAHADQRMRQAWSAGGGGGSTSAYSVEGSSTLTQRKAEAAAMLCRAAADSPDQAAAESRAASFARVSVQEGKFSV